MNESESSQTFDTPPAVASLRELISFGRDEVAAAWRDDADPYDRFLIIAFFSRATTTLEAIALLCEQSFGQQAMMLTRAVYELMVDAYWVDTDRARARKRFLQHARFNHHLRRELALRYPDLFPGDAISEERLGEDELKELAKLFTSYGTRSWTGLSVHKRLEQVEADLSPEDRHQLWLVHDVVYRLGNEELHPSTWSIKRVLRRVPQPAGGEMLQVYIGSEPGLNESALQSCTWIYVQFLHLVISVFGMPLSHRLSELTEKGKWNIAGGSVAQSS